jgi:protocatechuate 3,4-dioxygenase beta subunit
MDAANSTLPVAATRGRTSTRVAEVFVKSRVITLLFAAFLGPVLSAQNAPAPDAAAKPVEKPKKASISGRVVNAKTNEPLKKANVMLIAKGGGGKMTSSESDQSGNFSFADVEAGSYSLMCDRQGYSRQMYGSRGNPYIGATLTVGAGQEIKDLSFAVFPQAVITGKITDEDGDPMNMIAVAAVKTAYARGKKQYVPLGYTMTNDAGEYRLANLAAGKYLVVASQRNLGMGMVAGSAKPSDKPEPGYPIVFYPNSQDAAGAAPVTVSPGAEIRAIDIRLNKLPAVRLSGMVTGIEAGKMMIVMLMPRSAGVLGAAMGKIAMAQAADGKFDFKGIVPGSYIIAAISPQNPTELGARLPVEVGDQNITNIALAVAGGSEVKGTFTAEGDSQPKLSGLKVSLTAIETPLGNSTGTSGDDGTFTMKSVAADKYEVGVGEPPAGYYVKAVKYGGREAPENQIEIPAGATSSQIEVVLSPNAASVEGSIRDKEGKPMSGITIALIPKGRQPYLFKDATTDQSGHFEFKAVVPGEYIALAWEDIEMGAYQDPEFLKNFESKATKLDLKEHAHEVLDLKPIPAETVADEKQKG